MKRRLRKRDFLADFFGDRLPSSWIILIIYYNILIAFFSGEGIRTSGGDLGWPNNLMQPERCAKIPGWDNKESNRRKLAEPPTL